ncbi:MAG: carboxymuconolactone decarboxylase family protein [Chloroflexota bacterium]
MAQKPTYLDELRKHDPEFFEVVSAVVAKTREAGALDPKTKTLITLALDAAGSHPEGVVSLAARARALGAKEKEIIETIRLAFLVAGIPGLVAGLAAFRE